MVTYFHSVDSCMVFSILIHMYTQLLYLPEDRPPSRPPPASPRYAMSI